MLLIKDDGAAAQLYPSLCSLRWHRRPPVCLFGCLAARGFSSSGLVPVRMLGVGTGTWLGLGASLQFLGVEMFLIAFFFLYIMVIPEVPLPGSRIDADNRGIFGEDASSPCCVSTPRPQHFPQLGQIQPHVSPGKNAGNWGF